MRQQTRQPIATLYPWGQPDQVCSGLATLFRVRHDSDTMGIIAKIEGFADRTGRLPDPLGLLPGGVVAVVTGYLSTGVAWINKFGWFGWWSAGLVAFMLFSTGMRMAMSAWRQLQIAGAIEKWKRDVVTINPLDRQFTRVRIAIRDLRHPANMFVDNKVFVDCELVGPGNIALLSGSFNGVNFTDCDFVVIDDETKQVHTALGFRDCAVTNCQIINTLVMINKKLMYEKC